MNYTLRSVNQARLSNDSETFRLNYHRGRDEATVVVTAADEEISAKCEELPADSFMDEHVLEELATEWVEEHGSSMGDV